MKNDDESGRSSLVFLLLGAFLGVASSVHASLPPSPPLAPVRLVTETYYGTKVADQYRYMENLSDPEVQAWMHAQDDYTRRVIESISGRAKLLARIKFSKSKPGSFGQADLLLVKASALSCAIRARPATAPATVRALTLVMPRAASCSSPTLPGPEPLELARRCSLPSSIFAIDIQEPRALRAVVECHELFDFARYLCGPTGNAYIRNAHHVEARQDFFRLPRVPRSWPFVRVLPRSESPKGLHRILHGRRSLRGHRYIGYRKDGSRRFHRWMGLQTGREKELSGHQQIIRRGFHCER